MSTRTQILHGTARASVGLVIAVAAAGVVAMIGTAALPTVEEPPPMVEVDTTQNSVLRLACSGSFSLLGADVDRPEVAVPTGEPTVTVTGQPDEVGELAREEGRAGLPAVFSARADQPLAAAQVQQVSAESGRGVVASACASPVNDQWLLGGDTMLGVATTLSLGNPGDVPATAQITVYDENGKVADREAAAVRVSPRSQVTVPINGYATDRERIAVHVASSGAPVTASLGVTHVIGLDPFAAAGVTRQTEPSKTLVVPGVANIEDRGDDPTHDGDGDGYKVLVRVLAPGSENGEARVSAIDQQGKRTELGTIGMVGGAVAELEVQDWPEEANAVVIDADVPVIGGVLGSANSEQRHDYGWFAPAPELRAGTSAAAAVVRSGRLILTNVGEVDAEVEIAEFGSDAKPRQKTVPAGAAVEVQAPQQAVITSSEPIHAGVRVQGEGDLDGYPILSESQREGALKVYVR